MLWLVGEAARKGVDVPALYQCCGTEDFLYRDNVAFREACRDAGVELTYEEGPGAHEWAYWDARIQDVLNWLPIKKLGEGNERDGENQAMGT